MPVIPGLQSTLYRRAVGAQFDCLPPALRRFHDSAAGSDANGAFRITRGQGKLRNLLAALMRLPEAGEQVHVHLSVTVERDGEIWTRHFGAHRLVTRQWFGDELLVEAAGPLRFGFRLSVDGTSLRFDMERCWLLVLPVPLVLAPRVHAVVTGREASWWTIVEVEAPLLGLLARYEGEMIPRC